MHDGRSVGSLVAGLVLVGAIVAVTAAPVAGRPQERVDGVRSADRHRQVVDLAYDALLGRPPEPDGADYWAGQLATGLRPVDLVLQLAVSPEYLGGRPDRPPGFESPLDTLALLVPAGVDAESVVAAAADDTLRVRRSIAAGEFASWVDERVSDLGAPATTTTVIEVSPALVHVAVDGGGQRINVAFIHRSPTRAARVSPPERGLSTVGTWAEAIGADVAINGNWFGPWDGPAISGGQVYGGSDHGYTALFGFTSAGDVVIEHHRQVNDSVDPRVVDGVSGHPTLVLRGTTTTDFGTDPAFLDRHPRTAIGLDRSGDILILVTVDGRQVGALGMTGDETARLLERLEATDAVMLDGGGSTTMWLAGRVVNRPSGQLRAVGNQLAAFAR